MLSFMAIFKNIDVIFILCWLNMQSKHREDYITLLDVQRSFYGPLESNSGMFKKLCKGDIDSK